MNHKKNFVLDTNVLLHDYQCLENFEENDIYIPMMVLEELDGKKVGSNQINFNARKFSRELESLATDKIFSEGIPLGEGRGKLFILAEKVYPEVIEKIFHERIPDNYIIAATYYIQEQHPDMKTILVTKDVNMNIKARAVGLLAEDYITDKVTDVHVLESTTETYEGVEALLIDELYKSKDGIDATSFPFFKELQPNDCFALKSDRSSAIARYNPHDNKIKLVTKKRAFGIDPRNTEQSYAMDLLFDPEIKLIALTGRSGTGKTLLALAAAIAQNESYQQILLSRPVMTLGDKDMGALPGGATEKVMPYMQPLFDNLSVIKHAISFQNNKLAVIEEMQKSKRFTIEPLAYIRGRSLSETYFIVDEAQNLTPHEIKTIITRASEGTKIVFTGDIEQIDSPYLDRESNGLVYTIDKMKGQHLFAHINLMKGERSELSELASQLL